MSLFEDEVEETSWTCIMFLFSIVVGCFSYRFFGPDLYSETTTQTPITEKEEVEKEVTPEPEILPAEAVVGESEAQESSDGSEFENISPSEIPSLSDTEPKNEPKKVEEIGTKDQDPEEEVEDATETVEVLETAEIVEEAKEVVQTTKAEAEKVSEPVEMEQAVETESAEVIEEVNSTETAEEETEEDLVRTMDLGIDKSKIDAALDEYLGREVSQEDPVQKTEEKTQKAQMVVEPVITPINVNEEQTIQMEPVSISEMYSNETMSCLLEDTIMTPHVTKKAILDENDEVEIQPIILEDKEESESMEEKIEIAAQQLIESTISQVKSNEIKNIQDAAGDITENKTEVTQNDEEKAIQSQQLKDIADLIEKTPGMAGEGVDVAQQAKMYLD